MFDYSTYTDEKLWDVYTRNLVWLQEALLDQRFPQSTIDLKVGSMERQEAELIKRGLSLESGR